MPPVLPPPSQHTHTHLGQDTLNTAVRHDVVVVVPSTPAPPPRLDAPAPLLHSWLGRCHAFAALTAYGGVPCVVVPVGQLDSSQGGGAPLSVCLFGHSRSDQRLLTVAERLAMHAQVCVCCAVWV